MRYSILSLMAMLTPVLAGGDDVVDFNRDIRPIFTKECTSCHGGVKEAGNISFIYRTKAVNPAKSGKIPIVPGKPEESEVMIRLRSKDPDEVMPKPKHGPSLPDAQIALIERWIFQGAKWQNHWSFELPVETQIKQLSDEKWPSNSLDRFVLQRLDQEKIKPSAEAPPEEWLRRVSFDIVGLPPSPEDLTIYQSELAKNPIAAREAVVDRLLTSPHFGERWAPVWLDLARYSDTTGFEKDGERDIWPYRDWVIRAFNNDMPYDQFTIEQLAGDLLPNATADQRLATAFHRNTQTNTEGGTDDEEFRVAAVMDRVSTTWTAWQATTFGCVQCHSHPYDPIDHDEYYKFMAFFNGTEDSDLDEDVPHMKVLSDAQKTNEASGTEIQMSVLREQLNSEGQKIANSIGSWSSFTPDAFSPDHGKLTLAGDGTIRAEGTLPTRTTHKVSGPAPAFTAIRLRILPEDDNPKKWPERGSFVNKFDVGLMDSAGKTTRIPMKEVFADRLGDLTEPTPEGDVGGFPKLEGPRWFVFVPVEPVNPSPDSKLEISLLQKRSTAGSQATPVRRFDLSYSNSDAWTQLVNDPARVSAKQSLDTLKAQYKEIKGTMVPVMAQRPDRETRVFARGNRLAKEDLVMPGVPILLANGAPEKGMTRLDMAKWIASSKNPLTARVMVNRLWGELFGTGIVKTSEDFGTSGTPPSHPELLDHLALHFVNDSKWSIKSMLRVIVLSSTYRQTHNASAELVKIDPENRLLARGPRNRLSAEMVRDQALAIGGLLSPKVGGPPVFPPQPDGIWRSVYNGGNWKNSTGEDRYRRGIYTFSKRTSGYPSFLTFDAPSRDLCSARRIVSNTPLQALVTLNDPAHIEAAQGFAKRMAAHSTDLREQLAYGVLLANQDVASTSMIDELVSLHTDAAAEYATIPTEASQLAESPSAAALVLVANTILNLDTSLTR